MTSEMEVFITVVNRIIRKQQVSKAWEVSNCSKNGVTCGQKAGAAEMNHIQSCQFLKAETIIGHMNSISTKI